MQDNLRLILLTIAGVIIAWFITMTVSTHAFQHTDIDALVSGIIPMNRTDIGAKCGDDYVNSVHIVEYKLNTENQIVYLCPLGIWPIRNTVVAASLSDAFRKSLTPVALARVNIAYPPETAAPANAPAYQPPPPTTTGPMNANSPTSAPAYMPPQAPATPSHP